MAIPELITPTRTIDDRVLIVLNTNARRVNEQRIYEVLNAFHDDPHVDVVTTTNEDSIKRIRDHILEDEYGAVVCGGGDGTVIGIVNALVNENPEGMLYPGITSPLIVPTRLGTGGAYSRTVGGAKDLVLDTHLVLAVEDLSKLPLTQFPLMEITTTDLKGNTDTHYGTFAGQGWDAQILAKYGELKAKGIEGIARGYRRAINSLARSIFWDNDKYEGTIHFPEGSETIRLSKRGKEVLYRGESVRNTIHYKNINAVITGTSELLGYGLKGFPLAEEAAQDNKFHLELFVVIPVHLLLT